jgi:hypothetical protein
VKFIALAGLIAGLMAVIFCGLSVLLINIVGCLWPDNGESQSDRVVMIAGARQTKKQQAAKVS